MKLKEYAHLKRGNASCLAKKINISPMYVSQMVNGKRGITPKNAALIEKATAGRVSRKDIYPDTWKDIWPELE